MLRLTCMLERPCLDGSHLQHSKSQPTKVSAPFTFEASNSYSLRIYPDSRPQNLEIAPLQKGLILIANGNELVEEGAGFGVPIVKYGDETYFSSTAQVCLEQQNPREAVLKKVYYMDTVSRKQIRRNSINPTFYSIIHKAFEKAYLTQETIRPVFDLIMGMRKTLGITTQFTKVTTRGRVEVIYHCQPNLINIYVDFSALDTTNCQEILILNEQGASFFRQFFDKNGVMLLDKQIGPWTKVTAEKASFSDIHQQLSFSLENIKGAAIYRGREKITDRFSWAGMTYSLNANTSSFAYTVRIEQDSSHLDERDLDIGGNTL